MALLHVNFFSNVLGMDTGLSIIMPEEKQEIGQIGVESVKQTDDLPVLWLLHGRSNDETMWARKTSLERYVGSMRLIVIMPSVSYSRYMNMAYGPRYYDYMTRELPVFCKKLLPKLSMKREKNYIGGLSMGGAGAMWIGLKNTDRYSRVCMLSTGGVPPLEGLWRKKTPGAMYLSLNNDGYGVEDVDTLEGTEYDILKLIRDTARTAREYPKVYHAMGQQDIRYPVAMAIKETFESIPGNPFEYEYHEGSGKHEWGFWDTWIEEYLKTLPEAE